MSEPLIPSVTIEVPSSETHSLLRQATDVYLGAQNNNEKLAAVDSLEMQNNMVALRRAGEMCIEISSTESNPDEQRKLFNRARRDWEFALVRQSGKNSTVKTLELEISSLIANSPLYWALLAEKNIPETAILQEVYAHNVTLASIAKSTLESTDGNRDTDRHLVGRIQEANVLLLLQRFGLKLGGQDWLAVPSLFSQDYGHTRPEVPQTSWDISVYTWNKKTVPPELTYKIQVKSNYGSRFKHPERYSDEVKVMYVASDLKLKKKMNITDIGAECMLELQNPRNMQVTHQLDTRTEKLLDILG